MADPPTAPPLSPDGHATREALADADGADDDSALAGLASDERRQRMHEANNRLAAVIMNLAFARTTLAACPSGEHLTPLERADLATALEHAEDAANQLALVVRQLA